jgi:hypothetical protein
MSFHHSKHSQSVVNVHLPIWQCIVPCAVAVLTAAGCATHSTSVGHRMLLPEDGPRHETEQSELFVMPVTLASPEPAFPTDVIVPSTYELTVCAEIWLSADGDITRIAPFDSALECADDADPQVQLYARSVTETLRLWEFTPAMICKFPPELLDKRAQGDCTGSEVKLRRVPVRLNYAFTFSSRDGRRKVGFVRNLPQDNAPME